MKNAELIMKGELCHPDVSFTLFSRKDNAFPLLTLRKEQPGDSSGRLLGSLSQNKKVKKMRKTDYLGEHKYLLNGVDELIRMLVKIVKTSKEGN